MTVSSRLFDWFYEDDPRYQGTERFLEGVRACGGHHNVPLDVGAGPNVDGYSLCGHFGKVIGVDIDRAVPNNNRVHEAYVIDGKTLPLTDNSFDAAMAEDVLEHLEHPTPLLREIARVLKSGGAFLFCTPTFITMLPPSRGWPGAGSMCWQPTRCAN